MLSELCSNIGGIFGNSVPLRSFIVICSFSFLLDQIYSNGFTSIITIALPPKQRINTFQDMVDSHYKIIYEQPMQTLSVETAFGKDFKSYGLSVKNVFKVLNYTMSGEQKVQMMMDERLGMHHDSSMSQLMKLQVNHLVTRKGDSSTRASFSCFIIQQTFAKSMYHWYTKTENQYWLKGSVKQLVASGLYTKWDEWAFWQSRLKEKTLDESVKTEGPEMVMISQILALITSLSVLISIAVVVLFVEIDVTIMKILYFKIRVCNWMKLRRRSHSDDVEKF
ncbi:unnamed protein product [Orchesella dallaii]|uniref:Uncharacterized protein n=1 Tax=Orchesella dallaii TaxID=48710 RepID=A0ABP1QMU7_9HEXA